MQREKKTKLKLKTDLNQIYFSPFRLFGLRLTRKLTANIFFHLKFHRDLGPLMFGPHKP